MSETIHGTVVRIGEHGVLILGTSGSGKSDLALRLIDQPGHGLGNEIHRALLVADDRVHLRREQDKVFASGPESLRGLIEVRGVGILKVESVGEASLALVVDLVDQPINRMPENSECEVVVLGQRMPRLHLKGFEASAPAKIRAYLNQLPVRPEKA